MYKIDKKGLPGFLSYLATGRELIIPVKKAGVSYFKAYEAGDRPFLGKGNTDHSAKQFFLPYREVLFTYDREGAVHREQEKGERVIFGLRPCDLHAIAIADMFYSDEPPDAHYIEKRERTVLIAIECTTPGRNCFCDSLGMRDPIGHDILLFEKEGSYYARAATDKGKSLLDGSGLFQQTEDTQAPKRLPCRKKVSQVDQSLIRWDKWGARCFACSACTSVCPTCVCFDIQDELQFSGKVERQRTWASCFTKDFTTVAGGHCFRPSHREMLKQFVNHKFPYFKDKFGVTMCVGCGRCISACTAKIDITKVVSGK